MGDVDVGPDARVVTFANEAGHLINAAEQAEAKGFKFEGNVDAFAVGVVSQDPAALEPYLTELQSGSGPIAKSARRSVGS